MEKPRGPALRQGRKSRQMASRAELYEGAPLSSACDPRNAHRDELLNGEIFNSLMKAQIFIEQWHKHYNTFRPHSALNYRPPALQTLAPLARHLDEIKQLQQVLIRWYKNPSGQAEIDHSTFEFKRD